MDKKARQQKWFVLSAFVLLAALSRLLPHPPNFTPIGSMALFGAAYFSRKYLAFLVPILAFWVSDLVLNNVVYAEYFESFSWFSTDLMWSCVAMALIVVLGRFFLKKVSITTVLGSSLVASIVFFVFSNFGVWASGAMYSMDLGGLMAAFAAGIPFFGNTVVGNLFYSAVLFGGFEALKYQLPYLQKQVS
ncbi:MAG: DUF6580 family putative transport protein [Chitinophagales bacterium]